MELNSTAIKPTNQMCHGIFADASVIASSTERTTVPQLITDRTGQEQNCAAGYWPLATAWMGSIAPLRFLDQLTFDQSFMLVGAPNLWRAASEITRRACDIELHLLRLETGHSLRDSWRA
jgi:hypothetical protein